MPQNELTETDLYELEAVVGKALKTRDESALNIVGHGEISVALGWPIDNPTHVCKRSPPFTQQQFNAYQQLVSEYVGKVEAAGLAVADTTITPLTRGDKIVCYLVQPLLETSTLGHNVLKASEPDPDHPFLVALAESLNLVTPDLSIDAQVTNFSWDQSKLTLVDVGTPFMWDGNGKIRVDMAPFSRMLPAPTRWLAVRELTKLVTRWNEPRSVGVDIVANLYREGLEEWVDPTVIALNRMLGSHNLITAAEGLSYFQEDAKLWPALKRAQRVERWWQTSVRRRPYDWFIHTSFG